MDKCPQCNGAVWDNREENKKRIANGQKPRPEFSCKNKDNCGWVQWAESKKPKEVVKKTDLDLEFLKLAVEMASRSSETATLITVEEYFTGLKNFYNSLKEPYAEI